ncbi:N-acetylmuramoyl-L-alanine amidase [bacterium]|nr:N-acetylmuramoyl-L-alanine amidase [bacterium]
MFRGLILILCFLLSLAQVNAFEIVLPKEKKSIVNTNYAFFVGQAKGSETLTINDEHIHIASNGAFAHSIKLKEGENRIFIRSPYGIQVYKIYKNTPVTQEFPAEEFDMRKAVVNCDNTPMRSTPVDAGLNRIGHLFKGTEVIINGSKGEFYRVFLAERKVGWIMKKDITFIDCNKAIPAEFIDMKTERFKNAAVQTIEFTKKLPYTIEEDEKEIILRIYNPELSENSIYNLSVPKPEKYIYKVTLDGAKYTFKVKKVPESLKEITVAIDAGHGGYEKGAIGCLGDEEKVINLKIAEKLAEILKAKGANVVMTRECDGFTSLDERVKIARDAEADIFVSIHLNSIGDIPMDIHKNRGTSVYYFNNNSKQLAEIVEDTTASHAKTRKDGVKAASFAVIRPTDYVGILVETAYMTNPLDSVLYRSEKFPQKAAEGIAKGIIEFVKK